MFDNVNALVDNFDEFLPGIILTNDNTPLSIIIPVDTVGSDSFDILSKEHFDEVLPKLKEQTSTIGKMIGKVDIIMGYPIYNNKLSYDYPYVIELSGLSFRLYALQIQNRPDHLCYVPYSHFLIATDAWHFKNYGDTFKFSQVDLTNKTYIRDVYPLHH